MLRRATILAVVFFIPTASCNDGPPEGFVSVTAGSAHSCASTADQRVVCWGAGAAAVHCDDATLECGQSSPPSSHLQQVTAGDIHTCAITEDGHVLCWGDHLAGQLHAPAHLVFSSLTAGSWHSCGITDNGQVACWGFNGLGQANPPGGDCASSGSIYNRCRGDLSVSNDSFTHISAGLVHTCGIKTDGTLTCWGAGSTDDRDLPNAGQSQAPAGHFVQVTAGTWHSCALRSDGIARCWGAQEQATSDSPAGTTYDYGQTDVPANERFLQISAGNIHSCGLREDRSVVCWGSNEKGQSSAPNDLAFASIATGWEHSCGLTVDGDIVCWGSNEFGQSSPPPIP